MRQRRGVLNKFYHHMNSIFAMDGGALFMAVNLIMKKCQNRLESLMKQVDEKVDSREDYYDERSEDWQESDKGYEYQEATDLLERFRDELDMALDTIKEFNGDSY